MNYFSLDSVSALATLVSVETIVSNAVTVDGMAKKPIQTVPIHARLPVSDVAEIDKAADDELTSRSNMIARIVREWVKRRLSQKPRR